MKKAVKWITTLAMAAVVVGGSMLDSPNLAVPLAFMVPGLAWLALRIVITEVCK